MSYSFKQESQNSGGVSMSKSDEIMQFVKENNGIVTTSMITDAGFLRGNLKHLSDAGKLEKTARGVYILPEIWEDEFMNLQSRFKKGVYSLETSLFLFDLTDKTPNCFYMTFPSTYNLTKLKNENVRCVQVVKNLYELGIETVYSPNGNLIKAYSMERTLCDILKPRSNINIQIVTDAFKMYAKRKDKNIPKLSEYAKILKVESKIRPYLEVLL